MLTYSFQKRGKQSLYEYLYANIKKDIISSQLRPDEKLPSKRALAKHLGISTITVENAYAQLMAEGYIYSVPKSGYFVSNVDLSTPAVQSKKVPVKKEEKKAPDYKFDLKSNAIAKNTFPFVSWANLMRNVISIKGDTLLESSPSTGVPELRQAIASYLYHFRGMVVDPEQIVIGAGTEYLYSLIIQLLGRDKSYALEDPGYRKIARIYAANDVSCVYLPLDENGVSAESLNKSGAQIVHLSPSHHFPTGTVMPVSRRYELLSWAAECDGRYIIEDDYDSEFRLLGRPIPSLESIDSSGKVIYINTFSKSLSPTIRISYMILPHALMEKYKRELGFYSCTVANFEQYTLAEFISRGYFEKHINRMRTYYRTLSQELMQCIRQHPCHERVQIMEEKAGLHFLLKVDTCLTDEQLTERAREAGINVSCLSEYYHSRENSTEHTLVINYSGLAKENIPRAVELLFSCIWNEQKKVQVDAEQNY